MPFVHRHRVRFVECDMQGVMHNAHYLAVVDDAVDQWFAPLAAQMESAGWDFMVKRATLEWSSPARLREEIVLHLDLARWGNTSFDVRVQATVADRPCVSVELTYVGVDRTAYRPMTIPDFVRDYSW